MIARLRQYDWVPVGVFGLALLLFTIGLGQQEVVGFESRFYVFALEMWRHGWSPFPTTYGVPYPDYPATSTWFIVALATLCGHLTKWIAVLPSAIAAALTMAYTYRIGALQTRKWGGLAVAFLLLTHVFFVEARTISPDQFVALAAVGVFFSLYAADCQQVPRSIWVVMGWLLFGFACRGPIGLVVPAGVMCSYFAMRCEWKALLQFGGLALLGLLLGCAVLFGVAYHVGGASLALDVWYMEVAGRLQDASLPWYFYFIESLGAYALTFPVVVVFGLLLWLKPITAPVSHARLLALLGVWILVVMVGLSIPAGKKIRYILAISPALSLLAAALFVVPLSHWSQQWWRRIVFAMCFSLPLWCLMGLVAVLHYAVKFPQAVTTVLPLVQPWVPWAVASFLLLQVVAWFLRRHVICVVWTAVLAFVAAYGFVVEPIQMGLNQGRAFVTTVEAERYQARAKLVFFQENPDGTPIKYVVNMPREEQPIFVDSVATLLAMSAPAFFVADPQHFAALPKTFLRNVHIVATGMVGHDPLIVFTRWR